jgi:hypothetical protein
LAADNPSLVPAIESDTLYVIQKITNFWCRVLSIDTKDTSLWCRLLMLIDIKNNFLKLKKPSSDLGPSSPDPSPLSLDRATIALVELSPMLSSSRRRPLLSSCQAQIYALYLGAIIGVR